MPAATTAAPKRRGRPPKNKPTDAPTAAPAAESSTPANGRRKRAVKASRPLKPFKLYLQGDDGSLSFVTDQGGLNGPDAVKRAVQSGDAQADVPLIPVSPRSLTAHVVKTKQREPSYVVETVGPRRRRRAAKSSQGNGGATPDAQPEPETPSVTAGNPFATE